MAIIYTWLHTIFVSIIFTLISFSADAGVTANFIFSTPGSAPAIVQFSDMSSSTSGSIVSWSWNFGDATTGSNLVNPSHIYFYPGVYNVVLTVTNSANETSSITKSLLITAPPVITTPVSVSSMGKEFWMGYGHHVFMENSGNTQNLKLYISTGAQPAQVSISLDSSGVTAGSGYSKVYNVPANSFVVTENLPKGSVDATNSGSNAAYDARLFTDPPPAGSGSEGTFRKKGIHIVSSNPVSVQAQISGAVTSGVTTLLPVNSWGYNYSSINSEQWNGLGASSWIFVVAKEDNTVVQITPSVTSKSGKPANTPFVVSLQKGWIYQLPGPTDASGTAPNLTGTRIRSIQGTDGNYHPVAVFAGSDRTSGETLVCGTGSGRDNDIQQLVPTGSWGTEYVTAPVSTNLSASQFQTSIYKVLVSDPTTVVKRNGSILSGLTNSSYYKFASNTADFISSDKPVLVAQFLSGASSCNGGSLGDPDMVFPSALSNGTREATFTRTTVESITLNYLTIVIPTAGLSSLTVDSSNAYNYVYPHPNKNGYSVVIKSYPATTTLCRIKCDSPFTAICYGLGAAESYAFNTGLRIKTGELSNKSVCAENDVTTLNCPVPASVYRWQVSTDGENFISVSDNNNYSGANTNNLQLTNLPSAFYGYRYRCVADGETGSSYLIKFNNSWTGAINSSWENAGNWSCNTVPAFSTDVEIPAGANVLLSASTTVGSLTVHPSAVFTIGAGVILTLSR